jgi:hypothetical protein
MEKWRQRQSNLTRSEGVWPGTHEWMLKVSKALLSWYLLRAAYMQIAPEKVTEQRGPRPDPKSKVQQAAIAEAEIFFDAILDAGAWTPELAQTFTDSAEVWGRGSQLVEHGWPNVDRVQDKKRSGWGLSRRTYFYVRVALEGGKEKGQYVAPLRRSLAVPAWQISRQLREAVLEEVRGA